MPTGTDARPTTEFDIRITDMTAEELDQQPFGVIRLDRHGVVQTYNLYESKLARKKREDVIGKNFFTDVAPCTKVKEFHGRFLEGVAARSLNATFGFVFKFAHGARNVDVSLYYKQADDSTWVLVRG